MAYATVVGSSWRVCCARDGAGSLWACNTRGAYRRNALASHRIFPGFTHSVHAVLSGDDAVYGGDAGPQSSLVPVVSRLPTIYDPWCPCLPFLRLSHGAWGVRHPLLTVVAAHRRCAPLSLRYGDTAAP